MDTFLHAGPGGRAGRMTDIRFYHLQRQTLDQALPQILNKALQAGHKIVVKLPDQQEVERVNAHLWIFHPNHFLPHGSAKDGFAEDQPVWLTDKDENPNGADVLVLTDGTESESVTDFKLCCNMLNGHDGEAVKTARTRWKAYQEAGHDMTYWQQSGSGRWEQKNT